MRAFVISEAGVAAVEDVQPPKAEPGHVVVDVDRAGFCGTDMEMFTGEMEYLHQGFAQYPIRIGHEWMGRVAQVGEGVDTAWLGRRVTGDTMIGCTRCDRCRVGRYWVCESRFEVGLRGGMPGALAEQIALPASHLHRLPDVVDDTAGAMVEPGGGAWRAVDATQLQPGDRALVLGAGTIGLLAAQFARATGAQVHVADNRPAALEFAEQIGFTAAWTEETLPDLTWHAVIDASNASTLPAVALEFVEPGRRVAYIGVAGSPSMIDSRKLVLRDVTAVGILGASLGLAPAIEAYATGAVDPRPLVAATISLEDLPRALAGWRPDGSGCGPKIHVRP